MKNSKVILSLAAITAAVLLGGAGLLWRAYSRVNHVALAATPKPVTFTRTQAGQYRPHRVYVSTFEPWVSANVGPQLVSAYVDTVLVRPGAHVRHGEILATLDCRNASASSRAVAMQARALDARQQAVAHESARTQGMLGGGFVSANEAERIQAQSAAQMAELEAIKARLVSTTLQVDDCVLRAPFTGEISARTVDPGAFVRPGTSMVSVVDRKTVRLVGNAPENDFTAIAPGAAVQITCYATGRKMPGSITRRAPNADPGTRTIHFEVDVVDPNFEIPVGTTGEIRIEVGDPILATTLPLHAASIRNQDATVYVLDANHTVHQHSYYVVGEDGGTLFVDPALPADTAVVTEGRALLNDGDSVQGKVAP